MSAALRDESVTPALYRHAALSMPMTKEWEYIVTKLRGQTDTGLANWDAGIACNSGAGTRQHPSSYKPSTDVDLVHGEILALPPRGPAGPDAPAFD